MTNQTNIKNALQRPYDLQFFATEVLNPVFAGNFQMQELTPATIEPTQTESKSIAKVYTYGIINLHDDTEIICYEINLQPKVKIEQSKIAIQHYARRLLTTGQAALINFVNPDNKNLWRFTFIAKDSIFTEKGSLEKATNAKRYTYLLGTSESCKTAAQRFEILANETSLTIETLTNAFSVEKLSKDFFDEYLQHYNNFVEYLTQSNFRQSVFNADDKAVRDFTKKMLGRIVFLYFVQKKGWLGASDLDYTDGLQNFMMQYYILAGANETFYENYLKKLFFDTLNKERENDNFEMPDGKTVKVPFLNGGLFDKTKYDNHILTFKSDLFHNNLNEDDPKYRGFLDFLNAYNFTIYEDSPDEQTVAVDPEMLGHIFENLLEDNKDKGAYYTPKEIVHYMCQESLTEYLKTNTENNENLEQLVKHKEINNISENELQQIDNLLDNVKICDPAIGSGAFPMGLLQEIYNIKEVITYHTNNDWKPAQVKENIIQNSIYGVDIEKGAVDIARLRFWLSLVVDEEKPKPLPNLDYKIVIGNSLVSKFEDEVIEIDWKLAQNSALKQSRPDLFERINENIKNIYEAQNNFFHSVSDKNKLKLEIRNLKIELLETLIKIEKQKLIESGIDINLATKKKERIETTERKIKYEGFNKMLSKLNILKTKPEKPLNYFNWELNFPEVLNSTLTNSNTSFSNSEVKITNLQIIALNKQIDVINLHLKQQNLDTHIINLQSDTAKIQISIIKEQLREIEKRISKIYGELFNVENNIAKEPDLSFTYLIKSINKGILEINKKVKQLNPKLIKENTGFDIVIGNPPYVKEYTNKDDKVLVKSLKENFASAYKKFDLYVIFMEKGIYLSKDNGIISYIIPDKWITQPYGEKIRNIILKQTRIKTLADLTKEKIFENATVDNFICIFQKNKNNATNIFKKTNNILNKELVKIKQSSLLPNRPFLLNLSDKDIKIIERIKVRSILLEDICYVNWGCRPTPQNIFIADHKINEVYKPLVTGRNITKYNITKNRRWVKYVKEMYNPLFKEFFESTSIIFKDIIGKGNIQAGLNTEKYYCDFTTINVIKWSDYKSAKIKHRKINNNFPKYDYYSLFFILSIVNSNVVSFFFNKIMKNGLHTLPNNVKKLPIPEISIEAQQPFIDKVDKILSLKKAGKDTSDLEQEIDKMVYELYGLTAEEIQTVEESIKQ